MDSHVYQGYEVSPFYDSMIAKIVCHGENRAEAIARMKRALDECVIEGVNTTLEFQEAILRDPRFERAELSTRFLDDFDWPAKKQVAATRNGDRIRP